MAKAKDRLSRKQKEANKFQWYKDKCDEVMRDHHNYNSLSTLDEEYKKMRINYNLYNNILDEREFAAVCQPYADINKKLPSITNKDIITGKIKVLQGMASKRAFKYMILDSSPEAINDRKQKEFEETKKYVESVIMKEVEMQIEAERQAAEGQEMSEEQRAQLEQELNQKYEAQTPENVKMMMKRKYRTSSEVLINKLLRKATKDLNVESIVNNCFKHGLISSRQVAFLGILNNNLASWEVNPLRFHYLRSENNNTIEDSEHCSCEYLMTKSQIVQYFSDSLTDAQIDEIYEREEANHSELHDFDWDYAEYIDYNDLKRVYHVQFKAMRRVGFLTYQDDEGLVQKTRVSEDYELNVDMGDILLEWEWILETYEVWKVGDIYFKMQPVEGQHKNPDNLYDSKLSYYGVDYDNTNSISTSLVERLKNFQYFYNLIHYRIEMLMATDKGKKVLMNINAVPDNEDINMREWQYLLDTSPMMWYNPEEEGFDPQDFNTIGKVVDLSLMSDIQKYQQLAEYVRIQAGKSVGITDYVEGQIGGDEAVTNSQQNLIQSSHILEPYFKIHESFKLNYLSALTELARTYYANYETETLYNILDDLEIEMIEVDRDVLTTAVLNLYVEDSSKTDSLMSLVNRLSEIALQSQAIDLADILKVNRQESVAEAVEIFERAKLEKQENLLQIEQQKQENQKEQMKLLEDAEVKQHERAKELIVLKETERRQTEIEKAALLGASYNPEIDTNDNGVNDFLEIARHGLDKEIKMRKQKLDEDRLSYQKEIDQKKLDMEKKKLNKK